jgi:hypothetical protein
MCLLTIDSKHFNDILGNIFDLLIFSLITKNQPTPPLLSLLPLPTNIEQQRRRRRRRRSKNKNSRAK